MVVFRDITIIAVLIVFTWKLLNAQLSIDLEAFSFTDFLNLVLALFSVALSVAFYFKANEASNQFYDNSYKFTKDMSEILGRIEAGFGERLRHLDEGYSGMRDRLDKLPQYGGATLSDVTDEEAVIKKKEQEQKAVIEDLARKAKLAEHEKQALFADLAKKSHELEQARGELRQMQDSRRMPEEGAPSRRSVLYYLANKIWQHLPHSEVSEQVSTIEARRLFSAVKPHLAQAAVKDMERNGLLDSDGDLTREAATLLRIQLRRVSTDSLNS